LAGTVKKSTPILARFEDVLGVKDEVADFGVEGDADVVDLALELGQVVVLVFDENLEMGSTNL
jgi:hypothetical protein